MSIGDRYITCKACGVAYPIQVGHDCNCKDKSQCWEPCGELGKSEEHAAVYNENLTTDEWTEQHPVFSANIRSMLNMFANPENRDQMHRAVMIFARQEFDR